MDHRHRFSVTTFALAAAVWLPAVAFAQSGTWITSTAGTYNWSQAANWLNGIVADGANNAADFATAGLTGPMSVTLDTPRTIGSLVFDNPTNTFGWTVSSSNTLTLSNGAAGGPTVAVNNAQITAMVSVPLAGTQGLTKTGPGKLTLTGTNTYSGGTTVANGTLEVNYDAALGTGNVAGAALSTVNFTGTTATTKSFAMNGGTISVAAGQGVQFAGSSVSGAILDGSGFVGAINGVQFVNVMTTPSVTLGADRLSIQFRHFTNGGTLAVQSTNSGTSSTIVTTLDDFTNQGTGAVNLGFGQPMQVNVSNFQSYGRLTIRPPFDQRSGQYTIVTNVGTSPLGFNSGSRTVIVASSPVLGVLAGLDLAGKNAIVAGGLFINDGAVGNLPNGGNDSATVIADYGSLVKGAGIFQNPVITQNGGRFQAGDSPGTASFGRFVFGPGGVNNYVFDINDATGTAGSSPDATGHANGWGLVKAVQKSVLGSATTPGNFTWTATPAAKLTVAIDTLLNSATIGTDVAGPMADFDPTRSYSWLAAQWLGTYAGPTDAVALDAATAFDTSGFLNPIAGNFGWSLNQIDHTLSVIYTPSAVPEPGTLALIGTVALVLIRRRRRAV